MQHRIIDSIAPGAILSMAEFTKHVICQPFTSNFEPGRTTKTGTGKSSSIAVRARFRVCAAGSHKFTPFETVTS